MIVDKSVTVLGVLEFSSIAIGISALDEMVKIAPIKVIDARTMCPGKYLIVFSGDVASTEYSFFKGLEIGGEFVVDKLLISQIHSEVLNSIGKIVQVETWDAIGIIETNSVASSIEAADVAAKESDVKLIEIRLAIGFGGKSYVKMIGSLHNIQASMEVSVANVISKNQLCAKAIISQPHKEVKPFFMK
jgi:microcompartment protein CcmL/EutN